MIFIPVACPTLNNDSRARRNYQGQLEPDAPEDVVQDSLGFGGYEHAPKNVGKKMKP